MAAVVDLQPRGWGARFTYFIGLLLCGLLYTAQLRRSHKGRLLRCQLVLFGLVAAAGLMASGVLFLTPVSVLMMPVAFLPMLVALVIDLGAGLATALVVALVVGGVTPFDPGVITILAVQGVAGALVVGERPRRRVTRTSVLLAGLVAGLAAALSYFLVYSLSWNQAPTGELAEPLRSAWVAAGLAGPLAAILMLMGLPLFQRLVGDIPLTTLIELEDLSNPLLKQIAAKSPGTWQHSLAMANMAEIAANAIRADGRLVRVGAYYHDLGKSLQPKYFVENLTGGETSPHDALHPGVSCDAIFAHVTEGVRVARKQGLHERIVDFMHMHHGDGLLEYFWAKCQELGNPDGLTEDDFRYPGVKPHSKETAILAICDAVEAASRTLRNPDQQAIEGLVQRIVYGKLHLGQLDQSGLTVADLRRISGSLVETIRHAHHGRIEYPWQRKAAAEAAAQSGEMATQLERPARTDDGRPGGGSVGQPVAQGPSATQRLLRQPPLDSLDAPRSGWRPSTAPVVDGGRAPGRAGSSGSSASIETAPTEQLTPGSAAARVPSGAGAGAGAGASAGVAGAAEPAAGEAATGAAPSPSASSTTMLKRPPTAAQVARATADTLAPPIGDGASEAGAAPSDGAITGDGDGASEAGALPSDGAITGDGERPTDGASDAGALPSDGAITDDGEPTAEREIVPAPPGHTDDHDGAGEQHISSDDRPTAERRAQNRASSSLSPGVRVFGPPPASRPHRDSDAAPITSAVRPDPIPVPRRRRAHTIRRDDGATEPTADVTVERALVIPPEAHRDDTHTQPATPRQADESDSPTVPRVVAPTDPD